MRKKLCFAVFAALVFFSANAFADVYVDGNGGGWQPETWTAGDGSAYWNGSFSSDGSGKGIGYYLTNTGAFSGNVIPGVIPYWGFEGGGPDTFGFNDNGATTVVLKFELAGFADQNVFGYYDSNPNLVPIFAGTDTAPKTVTFTPASDFGFYLYSPTQGYFTTDMWSSDDLYQHFALFKEADGVYWLGMEDLKGVITSSDFDYNDMIVKVTISSVPEPISLLLLGLGLVGLAGMSRRFKR